MFNEPYNQFMQEEESKQIKFGQRSGNDCLLEELLEPQDKKDTLSMHDQRISFHEENGKGFGRGKGRPKGDRKSKICGGNQKQKQGEEKGNKGHWSIEENKKYHWFLEVHHDHFIYKQMRRLDKIFKTMSLFIGSREAEQCRSHHQKMEKKYHSFSKIILYLRNAHYATEDTYPIYEDMHNNQINETARFLTAKQLQDLDLRKQIPSTPTLPQKEPEEAHFQHLIADYSLPIRQLSFHENHNNACDDFFGDCYDRQAELDNFLL